MKIVHLLASPYDSGPAETVVQLALAQRNLGHQVHVACDQKRTTTTAESLLLPRLKELGLALAWEAQLSVKSNPAEALHDVRALRTLEADVVHAHFSHDHALARLARRRPLIRSIHAPRSLTWSTPKADGWTVPMPSLLSRVKEKHKLVLPALVGPEFVPTSDRVGLRKRLNLEPSAFVVGMVSTFQPSRRHALGLEAFAQVKRLYPRAAHLLLVGDGELEPQLRAQVKALNLEDAVTFAGYQPGAAFIPWLQTCDEVWVLGLGNDFSGRAAAQARACGARVLAVDEGALRLYADTLVHPSVGAIAAVSWVPAQNPFKPADRAEVAQQVIDLYQSVME